MILAQINDGVYNFFLFVPLVSILVAFLVWLAMTGVVSARILKGEKAVASGDMSARAMIAQGGQIATVLLGIMLFPMIWKPGA
jgi:hypothetical protein